MSKDTPNLSRDIDALFSHMVKDLGHDLDDPKDWTFSLRSTDLNVLTRLGEDLSEEFHVELQESVETIEDDRTVEGPPLLSVVVTEALRPEQVKALAARFEKLAAQKGVTYEGVASYDPMDEEELFGWLSVDDAAWRLKHFEDTGLAPGAELSFIFALSADDRKHAQAVEKALLAAGIEDTEVMDDGGEFGVMAHTLGANDEKVLRAEFEKVERVAVAAKAELLGVQFEGPEGDEDEDEDDEDDED